MSNFKPGEFRITDHAMEIWKLPKGAAVLDIGCGEGEAVEYLENHYGYKACGIDRSMKMIKQGRMRNPKLDIKHGDGEFLDGFSSYSFDGVMMECVLSLINLPDEALHEAYCVLKKGGRLFLSDLFIKNPDSEFLKALEIEAERERFMPHSEGDCGSEHEDGDCNCGSEEHDHDHDHDCSGDCSDCSSCTHDDCSDCTAEEDDIDYSSLRAVNFRSSGRFLIEPLMEQLKEIGYTNIQWSDCSEELDNYIAEKLMNDGTLEGCFCKEGLNPKDPYKTGYFMLTAQKPL